MSRRKLSPAELEQQANELLKSNDFDTKYYDHGLYTSEFRDDIYSQGSSYNSHLSETPLANEKKHEEKEEGQQKQKGLVSSAGNKLKTIFGNLEMRRERQSIQLYNGEIRNYEAWVPVEKYGGLNINEPSTVQEIHSRLVKYTAGVKIGTLTITRRISSSHFWAYCRICKHEILISHMSLARGHCKNCYGIRYRPGVKIGKIKILDFERIERNSKTTPYKYRYKAQCTICKYKFKAGAKYIKKGKCKKCDPALRKYKIGTIHNDLQILVYLGEKYKVRCLKCNFEYTASYQILKHGECANCSNKRNVKRLVKGYKNNSLLILSRKKERIKVECQKCKKIYICEYQHMERGFCKFCESKKIHRRSPRKWYIGKESGPLIIRERITATKFLLYCNVCEKEYIAPVKVLRAAKCSNCNAIAALLPFPAQPADPVTITWLHMHTL